MKSLGGDVTDIERPYASLWMVAAVAIGTAAGALGIWFSVRLINGGREQRSRYLAISLLAIAAAYPLSFGPACWITAQTGFDARPISVVYFPFIWLSNRSWYVATITAWYAEVGESQGWTISYEGNRISWWKSIAGPGSLMPYRTTISCCLSAESDGESTDNTAAEVEEIVDDTD